MAGSAVSDSPANGPSWPAENTALACKTGPRLAGELSGPASDGHPAALTRAEPPAVGVASLKDGPKSLACKRANRSRAAVTKPGVGTAVGTIGDLAEFDDGRLAEGGAERSGDGLPVHPATLDAAIAVAAITTLARPNMRTVSPRVRHRSPAPLSSRRLQPLQTPRRVAPQLELRYPHITKANLTPAVAAACSINSAMLTSQDADDG